MPGHCIELTEFLIVGDVLKDPLLTQAKITGSKCSTYKLKGTTLKQN